MYEAPAWWSLCFDATLGFPGEGPALPHGQWRYTPTHLPTLRSPLPDDSWRRWARTTLMGKTPIHVSVSITPFSSNDDIHRCFLALAEGGNQTSPIAARFQTRPARIDALVGAASAAALTAHGGSAYNFHSRPFQYSRPCSLRLGRLETAAVTEELSRLTTQCMSGCRNRPRARRRQGPATYCPCLGAYATTIGPLASRATCSRVFTACSSPSV